MDLAPYLEALRRDLAATAAPGGSDVTRAAELLAGSLDASARLCLLEVLSDAADEITAKLSTTTVEVRLRGREADFVVTEISHPNDVTPTPPAPSTEPAGDVARITLRLPESLKDSVERAAAAEGISVNSWLVRAVLAAAQGGRTEPPRQHGAGRRITGFGKA
jgi:predicted HicB family RNase H-like nuclease